MSPRTHNPRMDYGGELEWLLEPPLTPATGGPFVAPPSEKKTIWVASLMIVYL